MRMCHDIIKTLFKRIYTPHFLHSAFSTLRTFYTPHFLHSALSTLLIFHTPHFLHSSFSTLRIFYAPHFLHSALRTPHSTYSTQPFAMQEKGPIYRCANIKPENWGAIDAKQERKSMLSCFFNHLQDYTKACNVKGKHTNVFTFS